MAVGRRVSLQSVGESQCSLGLSLDNITTAHQSVAPRLPPLTPPHDWRHTKRLRGYTGALVRSDVTRTSLNTIIHSELGTAHIDKILVFWQEFSDPAFSVWSFKIAEFGVVRCVLENQFYFISLKF